MLHFSLSVAHCAPVCPACEAPRSPTTTSTKKQNPPFITAKKTRKEPPPYRFGENPVLEDWTSNSKVENHDDAPSMQEEEMRTMSVSDPSGLTQIDSDPEPDATAEGPRQQEAEGTDNNAINQSLPPDSAQDTNITEATDVQKIPPKPISGVRIPKYSLPQKWYIIAEAFSTPKLICLTARKYKVANATIRHWKKLLENFKVDYTKNILIANESGGFVDGDGNVVNEDNVPTADGNTTTTNEEDESILVSMWRNANRRTIHLGRRSTIPKWASVHLKRYFNLLRNQAQPVTVNDLTNEYMSICPEETEHATYSALQQRIYRWAHMVNIVSQATTHQAQNSLHCHKKIEDWVSFIRQQINIYNIHESNTVNFDETNVNFSLDAKRTLDHHGTKTVNSVAASSFNRATVMIGVAMSGEKLTPFVIYKGKRAGQIHKRELKNKDKFGYAATLEYSVQQNAWMDEELMHDWITAVWQPYVTKQQRRDDIFLLILDEFQAHKCPSVLRRLASLDTIVEFIPAGYTSKLQVMDVGLNRPFKRAYTKEHFAHLRNFVLSTAAGSKFNPLHQDVAKWVEKAWDCISAETVLKTWKHIGIKSRNSDGNTAAYEDMLQTRIQLGHEAARV